MFKRRKTLPYGPRHPIDLSRFQREHPGFYTVHDAFCHYSHDRLIKRGKDCLRAWVGFNRFLEVVDPYQRAEDLASGQIEDFIDLRTGQGKSLLTVARELAFIRAAFTNAYRRNRITKQLYIEIPEGQAKFRRPLAPEEFAVVITRPQMSERLRRFYWGAYHTGHRSTAIEEWAWDRTDLAKRVIDFNIPGRPITNKRRCAAFPISDEFLELLVQWRAAPLDGSGLVIGEGPSTYKEADYIVREVCGFTDPTLVPRHCMRKMFATEMFELEEDPERVGFMMADSPAILRSNYVTFKQRVLLAAVNRRPRIALPTA